MIFAIRETVNVLWNLILTIRVWDVIDIVVVAYLIYGVLSALRRTSSAGVVKGIVLVLAVVWISSLLKLDVISYLLGQAMKMGVLVIIILFQPELRRFLEQVGNRRLSFIFKRPVKQEYIEACLANMVSACVSMSKSRTGALIAFERDSNLDDYIKTGTKIDAATSSDLLENIFYPHTPLHDGAVIIKDGRTVAAGCMLPLSINTSLSRELGMRHRAGIGITERTDAVAIIVSEESGSISVAAGGMLKRHLATDTFEKLLQNEIIHFGERRYKKKGGKR